MTHLTVKWQVRSLTCLQTVHRILYPRSIWFKNCFLMIPGLCNLCCCYITRSTGYGLKRIKWMTWWRVTRRSLFPRVKTIKKCTCLQNYSLPSIRADTFWHSSGKVSSTTCVPSLKHPVLSRIDPNVHRFSHAHASTSNKAMERKPQRLAVNQ